MFYNIWKKTLFLLKVSFFIIRTAGEVLNEIYSRQKILRSFKAKIYRICCLIIPLQTRFLVPDKSYNIKFCDFSCFNSKYWVLLSNRQVADIDEVLHLHSLLGLSFPPESVLKYPIRSGNQVTYCSSRGTYLHQSLSCIWVGWFDDSLIFLNDFNYAFIDDYCI